jgi:hypothetical protein
VSGWGLEEREAIGNPEEQPVGNRWGGWEDTEQIWYRSLGPIPQTKEPAVLSPAEQERLHLQRILRAAKDRLTTFEEEKSRSEELRVSREEALHYAAEYRYGLRFLDPDSLELYKETDIYNQKLLAYLDGFLFNYVQDSLDKAKGKANKAKKDSATHHWDYLEGVISALEDEFIARCQELVEHEKELEQEALDVSPPSPTPQKVGSIARRQDSKVQQMLGILEKMSSVLRKEIQRRHRNNSLPIKNREALKDLIRPRYSRTAKWFGPDLEMNGLGDQLFEAVADSLITSLLRDVETAASADQVCHIELIDFLSNSRRHREEREMNEGGDGCPELTQAYINWVCSVLDAKKLGNCCTNFSRRKTIDSFFQKSSVGVEQLFLDSLEAPNDVILVLLRRKKVERAVSVSCEILEAIGWKRDPRTKRYWRYSRGSGISQRKDWKGLTGLNLYKVLINGEIIGLCTPQGDIPWEESRSLPLTSP